jgi:hypothetical protein
VSAEVRVQLGHEPPAGCALQPARPRAAAAVPEHRRARSPRAEQRQSFEIDARFHARPASDCVALARRGEAKASDTAHTRSPLRRRAPRATTPAPRRRPGSADRRARLASPTRSASSRALAGSRIRRVVDEDAEAPSSRDGPLEQDVVSPPGPGCTRPDSKLFPRCADRLCRLLEFARSFSGSWIRKMSMPLSAALATSWRRDLGKRTGADGQPPSAPCRAASSSASGWRGSAPRGSPLPGAPQSRSSLRPTPRGTRSRPCRGSSRARGPARTASAAREVPARGAGCWCRRGRARLGP